MRGEVASLYCAQAMKSLMFNHGKAVCLHGFIVAFKTMKHSLVFKICIALDPVALTFSNLPDLIC